MAESDVRTLDTTIADMSAAQALKSKLGQLNGLVDSLDTTGLTGNARTWAIKAADAYGVHWGDRAATYAAINQIINSELPDIRSKMGMKMQGPEIREGKIILGEANAPPSVLKRIIANEMGTADNQIAKGILASRARYGRPGEPNTITMEEYNKQAMEQDAQITQHQNELNEQFKTIGSNARNTAPVNSAPPSDPINALLRWLGGGVRQRRQRSLPPSNGSTSKTARSSRSNRKA